MIRQPTHITDVRIKDMHSQMEGSLISEFKPWSRSLSLDTIQECSIVGTAMRGLMHAVTCGAVQSSSPTSNLVWRLRGAEVQAWVISDISGYIVGDRLAEIANSFFDKKRLE